MATRAFVFALLAAAIVSVHAGCEWYKNCGACVADSGCGWCSNDPRGVGSGTIKSGTGSTGKQFSGVNDAGSASEVVHVDGASTNGVLADWLVNVRGKYEKVSTADTTSASTRATATLHSNLDFEGTGYVASPYFGQTWGDVNRQKALVGLHKTKFTTELKATYTVTPYTKGTYTVSSVQSDTQATMTTNWASTFSNIEFQIGNIPVSGTISYPDTSKQDVYGSWPPNPTKFTTELKDGYTIKCTTTGCGGTNVRVKHIYNDQHMYIDPRFTTSFANKKFAILLGPLGTGLISGTASNSRLHGSDPCRTTAACTTSDPCACHENTRFLTELRVNDRVSINCNGTSYCQEHTVASIRDDAHLSFLTTLSSNLATTSKFKIKTFHSSPFTYARKATGGLSFAGSTSTTVTGYNSTSFTKNLMAGYALVAKVGTVWEQRHVTKIDSATSLTIDKPFTSAFGIGQGGTQTFYNYESCPSLTYENFDLRTENGMGVITSMGVNNVYDNVQYSKITTDSTPSHQYAKFKEHLKVGFTLTMDGITRTITKIVSNNLLHVDRAFKEGTTHKQYAYRYSVRKTGDFHLHWKPETSSGEYHQTTTATNSMVYSQNMIATTSASGATITKQDTYLKYPPVCYNTGRCVPKTSHSLVGQESTTWHAGYVLSSKMPHETIVADYVKTPDSTVFFKDCKPTCTITVNSTAGYWETRRVSKKINSTYVQTELPFNKVATSSSAAVSYRVRYVTGTGTVHASTGNTVTGASKETKTKFNSEFSSGWTITIGCGGATCTSANSASGQTRNISAISSDTRLTTTQAFTSSFTKVDYTIGSIPGLGLVTNSQNAKIIDGNTNTRFLEQLKVGYTIASMGQTRTITAITSNKLMTVNTAFNTPGITTPTSYSFSGKKGTGEVSVAQGSTPKQVDGTSDVTQTQFQNELALGYLFMLGDDHKVVTKILSNTKLEVDTAFALNSGAQYTSNDYNYESCWLSHGHDTAYTNKKVYVEDACEIKPGCCGFKVSSVVYPDRFAYFKIRPPHTNMNIRVVVKTTEDNVDLLVKKSAVPTTSSYDYKSVRESNPWALTIPQAKLTCPAWTGRADNMPPQNCDYWFIGVRGDNRYPQKTGASEYDLFVYTEFDWPNFLCTDAKSDQAANKCQWLGVSKKEDANMVTNDDSQAVMRLTPNTNQRKGAMYYSTKVHLYNGFETSFQFRMTGFSVGCNSVLYPSGFCGGGDGFAFIIQPHNDQQIGCTGSGLGYSQVLASKQGNDWSRHRCKTVNAPDSTCDSDDNGVWTDTCAVGTLCQVPTATNNNGGCGANGVCAFQDCTSAINGVLAVEFDTWNNLKLHDPKQGVSRWWINATEFVGYNDNHVAIFSGNGNIESDHALNAHFAATPSIPNLADGKNHTIKVKYWPQLIDFGKEHDGSYNRTNIKLRGALHASNIPTCGDCEDTNTPTKYPAPDDCYRCRLRNNKPGNLAIFVDDMKRPVLQTAISLRKQPTSNCRDDDRDRCVLDEIGNAYIGFTAATGGERAAGRNAAGTHATSTGTNAMAMENAGKMLGAAQNHEILNWKFCNNIGCVEI